MGKTVLRIPSLLFPDARSHVVHLSLKLHALEARLHASLPVATAHQSAGESAACYCSPLQLRLNLYACVGGLRFNTGSVAERGNSPMRPVCSRPSLPSPSPSNISRPCHQSIVQSILRCSPLEECSSQLNLQGISLPFDPSVARLSCPHSSLSFPPSLPSGPPPAFAFIFPEGLRQFLALN